MTQLSRALVCCCATLILTICASAAWGAGSPTVYVSTNTVTGSGTLSQIFGVDTTTGNIMLLVSTANADYEGLVVGPDNVAADNTAFLVYACDTNNNKVVRFNPAAATSTTPTTPEIFYMGGAALKHPQCGRITSTGDLILTSKDTGPDGGWWIFTGITNQALGLAGTPTPQQLLSTPGSSDQGQALKNTGDLLVVDNANNRVLRSSFPRYNNSSTFISSGLSAPLGIARRSDGDIFVSDQGGTPNIVHFNAKGQSGVTCQQFKKGVPGFMQMSLDDTLYVAVSAGNKGSVLSVNATTCQALSSFSLPAPAVGIALPPTTASQTVTLSSGRVLLNFGFAAFVVTQATNPCSGTVAVNLASPAAINNLIALAGATTFPSGASPGVNLGLDGFETVFSTKNLVGCLSNAGFLNFQIAGQFAQTLINPQIVDCTDDNSTCGNTSVETSVTQIGQYPLGGYLPADYTAGGVKSRCNLFVVNANPSNTTSNPGFFCGFNSPLIPNTQDPSLAPTVGGTIPVKFTLATSPGNNCANQNDFVTNAQAFISLAQISPNFIPITLSSSGSSSPAQPQFNIDGNKNYNFSLNLGECTLPSGVTGACPSGIYAVTVTFATNNTSPPQTIYTAQTTLFKIP